jgi:hypothetical protein
MQKGKKCRSVGWGFENQEGGEGDWAWGILGLFGVYTALYICQNILEY